MIAALFGALGGLWRLISGLLGMRQHQADIATGEAIQTSAGSARAATTEAAVAQAEVDAPKDATETEAALDKGAF